MASANSSATADREIVVDRLFDAPRELVFRAFTDPERLGHWFGPDGFTTTTHEINVVPGGVWRFTMHGPDGVDYPNITKYVEISPFDRLVYVHGEPAEPVQFDTTITFEDVGGKTHLTMASLFPTPEARDYVQREYHAVEGAHQTDRPTQELRRRTHCLATLDSAVAGGSALIRDGQHPQNEGFKC